MINVCALDQSSCFVFFFQAIGFLEQELVANAKSICFVDYTYVQP
jgi:hypothetical protein